MVIAIPEQCFDYEIISKAFVYPQTTVRDAMVTIDSNAQRIALVIDRDSRLISTLTDGDIRRAILDGVTLDSLVEEVCSHKTSTLGSASITSSRSNAPQLLYDLMVENCIRQVPLVDEDSRVVGLVTLEDLRPQDYLPVKAVIMAGGFGKRLMPLTANTPKPMLPVGDKPLMEHTIQKLNSAGIRNVMISTHYMSEQIEDHFQDGSDFGVNVTYVKEDAPLGTAGALSLVEESDEPTLVMNGDILSGVDYRSIVSFHSEQSAHLTVCVRKYEFEVPYGVVQCSGADVNQIDEKPVYSFFVNAGIYLLSPEAHALIPRGQRSDMPDLVKTAISKGLKVISFPIVEHWLDIGQHADYEKAQQVVWAEGNKF